MKAILSIPEKEISLEYENLSINTFTPVNEVTHPDYPMMVLSEPGGKPITLITSNMPGELKDELITIIKKQCNH